jgi:hypothetical protein
MNQDPLLDKMDALLKRHRTGHDTDAATAGGEMAAPPDSEAGAPPPDAWLPVLTDVVVMGTITKGTEEKPPVTEEASPGTAAATAAPAAPEADVPSPASPGDTLAITDTLAEQLMAELEPRLATLLQDKIASGIRSSLDDTVSALLSQLDVSIREIVREAVDEKLGRR